ncbi:cysteine desulfurase [Philodulcilactobacillus myokoensis]|uniref:cysteine desulfurase n=1 Tax=Philodulcilactobacillus myokoensis TaxID=2929573 RepID=A0A9W6AZ85_9LACO|nr:cysteine desulfurase [Philodulcilactobacillus myokoensis]GLB46225.1 cysteine desulfurase [Philodulcilactobacillus myokoensis]
MNVERIRKDFPILQNRWMAYLDNAATSQKPRLVIDAINHFYQYQNFNVHRSVYTPAQQTTDAYENVRQKVADFIHADRAQDIIFTRGTTESLNMVASDFAMQHVHHGDEIVVSITEHHSNLLPWMRVAKANGAKLKYIPILDDGCLDLDAAKKLITSKTKIVALTAVSNVLGTINPIEIIGKLAHQNGAMYVVDAAQAAPSIPLDVQKFHPDFMAFSGHKMLGPTGIGVLYGTQHALKQMQLPELGGEMIEDVSTTDFSTKPIPWCFEAGTPNIAGVIGLGAAIDYLNQIGMDQIEKYCRNLAQYLADQLRKDKHVIVYGPKRRQSGIVSFNIRGLHAHDAATFLDLQHIYVRAGHHCAEPLVHCLGTEATLRASLYFYNNRNECDRLISSVKKMEMFFCHGH